MNCQTQIPQICYQGADFYLPILWKFNVNGILYPVNLSGYSVEMQVRNTVNSKGSPIINSSTANGYVNVDTVNGKIEITIPNSITSSEPQGCFVYDVKVTNNVGLVQRLFGGQFTIQGMVSQ